MEKEFVPYQLAVKLKALDYPQNEYFNWYDGKGKLQYDREYDEYDFSEDCCSAPTFSQAFRWFREKHHLEGEISKRFRWSANAPNPDETFYSWGIYDFTLGRKNYIVWLSGYDADKGEKACTSYEEAESACLDKLIQIIEGKEK